VSTKSQRLIESQRTYFAHHYHPLEVVAVSATGSWITDAEGVPFLDMLTSYGAVNFGHSNPRLVAALISQLDILALSGSAIHHDQAVLFASELTALVGKEKMLAMTSGAEAVETALKIARAWGYREKGVRQNEAEIIVMDNNFHGRTISIVSFSSDPTAKGDFGPYTPGFRSIPFGDAAALEAAIHDATVAVLLEPIQGEAGVIIPPAGYLRDVRRICDEQNVLFIADEVQSGLGRTGKTLAVQHENVEPDIYILAKALGGGLLASSAVLANADVMDVLQPGQHGSTFGANPLNCAVGLEVIAMLNDGTIQQNARVRGLTLGARLQMIAEKTGVISEVRCRGLWAGIDITIPNVSGRDVAEALLARNVIAKDTHGQTIRFLPPLTISERDLLWGLDQLEHALMELRK